MKLEISTTGNFPDRNSFEIVERKGIGHPDTLADGIAESISTEFSRFCMKEYGAILNHWVDKTLLTGALGEIDYGHGRLLTPIKLYIFGKMSKSFGGKEINLEKIIKKAVKNFMKMALPLMDTEINLEINYTQNNYSKNPYWMNPRDLKDLPNRENPRSNDTSVGVGFWPLSITENLTLELEKFFYNENCSPKYKYIGQDIKILSVREGNNIDITMCVPFIAQLVPNEKFYLENRDKLEKQLINHAQKFSGNSYNISLTVNNADKMGTSDRKKRKGYYFLVLGSALDDGEVGVVGRGNSASGVISCSRNHSMEAACGKNPVYHVGKVYTFLAHKIAKQISNRFNCEVSVFIASKMGNLLKDPGNVIINTSKEIDHQKVTDILHKELSKGIWAEEIIKSEFFIPSPGNLKRK